MTAFFKLCPMGHIHINHNLLNSLVQFYHLLTYKAKFNALDVRMKSILEYFEVATVLDAKEITEVMEVKALPRKSALNESQFLTGGYLALREVGTPVPTWRRARHRAILPGFQSIISRLCVCVQEMPN